MTIMLITMIMFGSIYIPVFKSVFTEEVFSNKNKENIDL